MPNQRAAGQRLIPFPADKDWIKQVTNNLPRVGYRNRSQFIRDAITEKFARAGITLTPPKK